MSFEQWLEKNQYDIDFGNDTIDLMKQAYVAGVEAVYFKMLEDFYQESCFATIMNEIKSMVEESK